jgi:pimeloyl-ACP methyl ester carboxylesterase
MSPQERENLTIVGHSLGGRIATRIAAELRRLDLPIKNICILGAALPCVDEDTRFALESGETCKDMTVIHIYNRRDKVLKGLFKNFSKEGGEAMGCHKYDEQGKPIHQFEVTWNNIQDANIDRITWDFIKGASDHMYLFYIIRLKKIVDLSKDAFN